MGVFVGGVHISVSVNKLSPRPDVSKTIWGLESVRLKNDTDLELHAKFTNSYILIFTIPADHFTKRVSSFWIDFLPLRHEVS